MNIANFQMLNIIPDFYIIFLTKYIMDISNAFSYAHKHHLVHGNFNLSKVIAQKLKYSSSY
jgi:hypothetical protein